MKIEWEHNEKNEHESLGNLKAGNTFMFVDYDLDTGPFLVINTQGYCRPKQMCYQNSKMFILNLATNTITHRTLSAIVRLVYCNVLVEQLKF